MDAEVTLPWARRTRIAARVVLVAWLVTLAAFVVLAGMQADGTVLAGLGGLASILFAGCFALNALASRRELREFAELSARQDLRAARSRRAVRSPNL